MLDSNKELRGIGDRSGRRVCMDDSAEVSDVWANFEGCTGLRREHSGKGDSQQSGGCICGRLRFPKKAAAVSVAP